MVAINQLAIPQAKINQLQKKGLHTTDDILRMVPLHHFDFSIHTPIKALRDGQVAAIYGEITSKMATPSYTKFSVQDATDSIDVFIFGQAWLTDKFNQGDWVTVGGKVKKTGFFSSFGNPDLFEKGRTTKILNRYSKIKGMSDDYLRKIIRMSEQYGLPEHIEPSVREAFELIDAPTLTRYIHHPQSSTDVTRAHERLLFDTLFAFQLKLFAGRRRTAVTDLPAMASFAHVSTLRRALPFALTDDQNTVLRSISGHFKHGKRLNALVQGDVGSGKTMIALFALLMAAENGHQGVLMAPTTVLAQQHAAEIAAYLAPLGFRVGFLHGGLKAKEKRTLLKEIASGAIHVVIGTHAAISRDVQYASLRVVIVDEEHRFGVEQRDALEDKASQGAHKISLTATPIPRTLAHTLFGDDIQAFTIKTMPSGRKAIKTGIGSTVQGLQVLRQEIKKGRQGYIVCPLIDENEDIDAKSVNQVYTEAMDFFKRDGFRIGMIHGQMKQADIDAGIQAFSQGDYDLLISTTIIEVGVNVPNATVMMIESADRFGLSQLHQLRGRVGRGSHQSFCLLSAREDLTEDAEKKLAVLVETTDGFVIADEDMKIRGTGNIVGIEQTGANPAIDSMMHHPELSMRIKEEIGRILKDPFRLAHYRYLFDPEN